MMINIKFNFDERKFRQSVEKEAKEAGLKELRGKLRGVVCPVHGTSPTVTAKGKLARNLSWTVSSCCDELQKLVNAKLEEKKSDYIFGRNASAPDMFGRNASAPDMFGRNASSSDILGG